MAAAGFNWSGGRCSGGRTIVLVLLCFPLICFSSSLSGCVLLAEIKDSAQKGLQNVEKLKDICKLEEALFRRGVNEYMSLLDHFMTLERNYWREESPESLHSVDMYLDNIKDSAEKGKANVEEQIKMVREEIKDNEDELKEQLRLIKCLEEGRGPCVRIVDPLKDKMPNKLPFDIATITEFMKNHRFINEKISSNIDVLRDEFDRKRKITLDQLAELPKILNFNETRQYQM